MSHNTFSGGEAFDSELAQVLSGFLAKYEHKVDGFLKKLRLDRKDPAASAARLDKMMLAVAAGVGGAKGLGGAARKSVRVPTRTITKSASAALLSFTALYILAQARLRGLSMDDPRTQLAIRNALAAAVALPAGQILVERLGSLGKATPSLPTDPRNLLVIGAGAVAGGYVGKALGSGITEGVYAALGDVAPAPDFDVDD